MGNFKDASNCCGVFHISKKNCHDILLMVIVVNILVGLVCLYKYMGSDDKWTVEPKRREKVLALAVFLFLSTCALCWFIMRNEQHTWESERKCFAVDRPPSYESCVSEQPPPSYFTVVNTIHIVSVAPLAMTEGPYTGTSLHDIPSGSIENQVPQ